MCCSAGMPNTAILCGGLEVCVCIGASSFSKAVYMHGGLYKLRCRDESFCS